MLVHDVLNLLLLSPDKSDPDIRMFAPDRQGFFPALWVQLIQELTSREKDEFNNLTSREDRVKWMYNHRFPKVTQHISFSHFTTSQFRPDLSC